MRGQWKRSCGTISQKKYNDIEKEEHPLVKRENTLKKLLEKGNYSNKYIKKQLCKMPATKTYLPILRVLTIYKDF